MLQCCFFSRKKMSKCLHIAFAGEYSICRWYIRISMALIHCIEADLHVCICTAAALAWTQKNWFHCFFGPYFSHIFILWKFSWLFLFWGEQEDQRHLTLWQEARQHRGTFGETSHCSQLHAFNFIIFALLHGSVCVCALWRVGTPSRCTPLCAINSLWIGFSPPFYNKLDQPWSWLWV